MAFGKREDKNILRDNSFGSHAFKPFRKCYPDINSSFSGNREKRKFANHSNNNIVSMLNEPNNNITMNKEKYNCFENKIYTSNIIDNVHKPSLNDEMEKNIFKVYRRVPIKIIVGFSDCVEKKNFIDNLLNHEDNYFKIRKEEINEFESYNNKTSKSIPVSRPNINFEKMRASTRNYVE